MLALPYFEVLIMLANPGRSPRGAPAHLAHDVAHLALSDILKSSAGVQLSP
jgi:hypothetical protein